jgi:hypothetical protein
MFVISSSLTFRLHNPSTVRKADCITIFRVGIILIGSMFVISSSLTFRLHNPSTVRNADRITRVRVGIILIGIILIGSMFVISSSLTFRLHNAASLRKADRITIFRVGIILIGSTAESITLTCFRVSPAERIAMTCPPVLSQVGKDNPSKINGIPRGPKNRPRA